MYLIFQTVYHCLSASETCIMSAYDSSDCLFASEKCIIGETTLLTVLEFRVSEISASVSTRGQCSTPLFTLVEVCLSDISDCVSQHTHYCLLLQSSVYRYMIFQNVYLPVRRIRVEYHCLLL